MIYVATEEEQIQQVWNEKQENAGNSYREIWTDLMWLQIVEADFEMFST